MLWLQRTQLNSWEWYNSPISHGTGTLTRLPGTGTACSLSTEKRQSKQRGYKDSCIPFACKTRFGVLLYTVWSPHIQEATQKLEMVQPKAARYVTNRYRNTSSVTSMLDHLQWEPLESRRIKHRLAMMFKILHGLIDIPTDKYLTPANTRMRSHHGQKFRQIQASTDYYEHSFFPQLSVTGIPC